MRLFRALLALGLVFGAAASANAQTVRAPRAPGWTPVEIASPHFAPRLRAGVTAVAPLFSPPTLEQTVVSRPNVIEFVSVDHDATDAGSAVITSYSVTLFASGSSTPAKPAVNIGKPPLVSGKVSYGSFASVWSGLPAGQYFGTVTANGPGGNATSPLSASPFSVDPRAAAAPGAPTFRQ